MSLTFKKNKENFICEVCGLFVKGEGFTNHCPNCLTSKHVDINPGDRKSECGGLMEAISVEVKRCEYSILHRCKKCGFERKNKMQKNDNFEKILELIKLTS